MIEISPPDKPARSKSHGETAVFGQSAGRRDLATYGIAGSPPSVRHERRKYAGKAPPTAKGGPSAFVFPASLQVGLGMNDQQPIQRSPRILVIDDQENIHEDYRKIIGRHRAGVDELDAAALSLFDREPLDGETPDEGFDLDCAFQGEQGRQMVQQALDEGRPYAMAFVDIRMPPGWDGIETVRKIWEIDSEILIVICSAYSDYSWEQMVRQLGRTDRFLILKKPFDVVEVRQFAMALTRRWSLARTDDLTGILNRRSLQEQLEREWAKSVRYATPLSCVMLDLDRFKQINDLEGHQAGDAVLKSVAAVIQQRRRASDLAFRYGGEEFCILLPNTTEAEAAKWAEQTRELIATTPATYESRSLHVTASMGVAERMLDTRCATVLVNLADEALRVAKQVGRNRVIRRFGGGLRVRARRVAPHQRRQSVPRRDRRPCDVAASRLADSSDHRGRSRPIFSPARKPLGARGRRDGKFGRGRLGKSRFRRRARAGGVVSADRPDHAIRRRIL